MASFQEESNIVFVGHAYATMQLNGLAGYLLEEFADFGFGQTR